MSWIDSVNGLIDFVEMRLNAKLNKVERMSAKNAIDIQHMQASVHIAMRDARDMKDIYNMEISKIEVPVRGELAEDDFRFFKGMIKIGKTKAGQSKINTEKITSNTLGKIYSPLKPKLYSNWKERSGISKSPLKKNTSSSMVSPALTPKKSIQSASINIDRSKSKITRPLPQKTPQKSSSKLPVKKTEKKPIQPQSKPTPKKKTPLKYTQPQHNTSNTPSITSTSHRNIKQRQLHTPRRKRQAADDGRLFVKLKDSDDHDRDDRLAKPACHKSIKTDSDLIDLIEGLDVESPRDEASETGQRHKEASFDKAEQDEFSLGKPHTKSMESSELQVSAGQSQHINSRLSSSHQRSPFDSDAVRDYIQSNCGVFDLAFQLAATMDGSDMCGNSDKILSIVSGKQNRIPSQSISSLNLTDSSPEFGIKSHIEQHSNYSTGHFKRIAPLSLSVDDSMPTKCSLSKLKDWSNIDKCKDQLSDAARPIIELKDQENRRALVNRNNQSRENLKKNSLKELMDNTISKSLKIQKNPVSIQKQVFTEIHQNSEYDSGNSTIRTLEDIHHNENYIHSSFNTSQHELSFRQALQTPRDKNPTSHHIDDINNICLSTSRYDYLQMRSDCKQDILADIVNSIQRDNLRDTMNVELLKKHLEVTLKCEGVRDRDRVGKDRCADRPPKPYVVKGSGVNAMKMKDGGYGMDMVKRSWKFTE